jgi:uncharacterized protein (TIGR00369 family)
MLKPVLSMQQMRETIHSMSFNQLVGIRLVRIHKDGVTIDCKLRPDLMNAHGVLHGGVTATMADAAVGIAITTRMGRPAATTVEMKLNYMHPVTGGKITARASAATAALIPAPNFGGATALSRNYFVQIPRQSDVNQYDVRLDHQLSAHNNVFGRFSFANRETPSPGAFPGFIGGGTLGVDYARQLVLADTHLFSPRMVNEFRFGYTRHESSSYSEAVTGVEFATQNGVALFPFPVQGFPVIGFYFSRSEHGLHSIRRVGRRQRQPECGKSFFNGPTRSASRAAATPSRAASTSAARATKTCAAASET